MHEIYLAGNTGLEVERSHHEKKTALFSGEGRMWATLADL